MVHHIAIHHQRGYDRGQFSLFNAPDLGVGCPEDMLTCVGHSSDGLNFEAIAIWESKSYSILISGSFALFPNYLAHNPIIHFELVSGLYFHNPNDHFHENG